MTALVIGATWGARVGAARAGDVTAVGQVNALTDFGQMSPLTGTAAFDEGPVNKSVPLDVYTPEGLTWIAGDFQAAFPGITADGTAVAPYYQANPTPFPQPIAGGGVQEQRYVWFGGVAKFTGDVTQVGLTASKSGVQYLTAWDQQGQPIGQVRWVPDNDAAFIGLDSKGVKIGLVAYGNDDMFAGATYNVEGATTMADTWVWAKGVCQTDAACDDGDACDGVETCVDGECVPGAAPECADADPCSDDGCDPVEGCVFVDNTLPCDDGDACTIDDVCGAGVCGGAAIGCQPDDDVCTADVCDADLGCVHDPIAGCCDEDADCARGDSCDVEANMCEDAAGSTGDASTGASSGDVTGTDASTGDPTTGDATANGTTGAPSSTADADTGATPTSGPDSGDTTPTATAGSTGDADSTGATDTTAGRETGGEAVPGGCGCRTRGDASVLLVMLALFRRRRRSCP